MDFDTMLSNISSNEDKIVTKKTEYPKDDRKWKLTLKAGADGVKRGSAKIRFLTNFNQALERPYVERTSYFIKGFAKKPYVENSRRSISLDEKDPVYELSGKLYKTDEEPWKGYTKNMRPKYEKIASIQVLDDPANPDNNGKYMFYDMPQTVFKKIEKSLSPDDAFSEKMNPFHPLEGADFIVSASIKSKDDGGNGIPDYDASKFLSPSAMCGGDKEKIMEALQAQVDLIEFIEPSQFKSYEDLLKLLYDTVKDDIPDRFFAGTGIVDDIKPIKEEPKTVVEKVDDSPAFEPDTNQVSETLDATDSKADEVDETEIDDFLAQMQKEISGG